MKKIVLLVFVSALFSSVVVVRLTRPFIVSSTEIIVPDQHMKIQWAIGNASDGDTIFVRAGTYYENVVVNKSVSLIGEKRNTTVIDGSDNGTVILVNMTSNVSIKGFTLQKSGCMCHGFCGVNVKYSQDIDIANNIITQNGFGIRIYLSHGVIVARNDVLDNFKGITVKYSSGNVFYHNNFMDNYIQTDAIGEPDTWDDNYPSGGNYWSDYAGADEYNGPNRDQPGSDGIGDIPYIINENNTDNFPVAGPISFFNAGTWNEITYYVHTASNSTISDFNFNPDNSMISFNATGLDDTTGFCRAVIPERLLWVENGWVVLVGNKPVVPTAVEDANYTYLYFTYSHSAKRVQIIGTSAVPEFSTWASMLLIFIVLTVAMVIFKRRLLKTPINRQ